MLEDKVQSKKYWLYIAVVFFILSNLIPYQLFNFAEFSKWDIFIINFVKYALSGIFLGLYLNSSNKNLETFVICLFIVIFITVLDEVVISVIKLRDFQFKYILFSVLGIASGISIVGYPSGFKI